MEMLSGPSNILLFWLSLGVQLRKGGRRTTEKWGNVRQAADTIEDITRHKHNTSILGQVSVARAYETVDDLSLCAIATPTAAATD
jgi:hypothetical protein